MKQKFSPKWIGSKQPRKQRKFRYNAPLHIRRKMISVNLTKDLRKKYGKRNFPVVKGDNVRIMRGEFKNKTGKIEEINMKKMQVYIEGIYRTKKDGTKVGVKFDPSNLQIKELELNDKKRKMALERKSTPEVKKEIKVKPLPKNKTENKVKEGKNAHK